MRDGWVSCCQLTTRALEFQLPLIVCFALAPSSCIAPPCIFLFAFYPVHWNHLVGCKLWRPRAALFAYIVPQSRHSDRSSPRSPSFTSVHTMAVLSKLRPIPSFRKSPNGSPPKYKGLSIGINYGSRPDALKGAVDDAKDFKTLLQGGVQPPLHCLFVP